MCQKEIPFRKCFNRGACPWPSSSFHLPCVDHLTRTTEYRLRLSPRRQPLCHWTATSMQSTSRESITSEQKMNPIVGERRHLSSQADRHLPNSSQATLDDLYALSPDFQIGSKVILFDSCLMPFHNFKHICLVVAFECCWLFWLQGFQSNLLHLLYGGRGWGKAESAKSCCLLSP